MSLPDPYPFLPAPVPVTDQVWPEDVPPLVSVKCRTYMHAAFIRDALEGFLMQRTTFRVELWIHDDASTDGTAEIVREYAERYPQLFVATLQVENQYKKVPKTPRFIKPPLTRGKYTALCEGDDHWTDPMKLERQVRLLEERPDVALSFHRFMHVDEHGKEMGRGAAEKWCRHATAQELKESFKVHTSTMVYRAADASSKPMERPIAHGGEKFVVAVLGGKGSGYFHADIQPSAYRHHGGGVERSVTDPLKRHQNHLRTRMALYLYHDRIGDQRTADHYFAKVREVMDAIEAHKGGGDAAKGPSKSRPWWRFWQS